MTDDEAFIRAIVNAPADDAPRLVYADWLDERDDPRGAYLREEVRFARSMSTHGIVREQQQNLDPLWVARISRPPLGVCCHHINFFEHDPRLARPSLTIPLLDMIEGRLGVALPAEYRAFLLSTNGGVPEPGVFARADGEWAAVGHFHTIWLEMDGASDYAKHDFLEQHALFVDDPPWSDGRNHDMIEIGYCDFGDRGSLCLAWRGPWAGRVFQIDRSFEMPEPVLEIADTLSVFLSMIQRPGMDDDE
jgi:uncharacterized protein (TIGR02996 family)